MECGIHLRIIGGYRHPTMGKDTLLCSKCFDTVFESVEKYRRFITPYIGFFNKESSTTNGIKHTHSIMSNLWSNKIIQNAHEDFTTVQHQNMKTHSG